MNEVKNNADNPQIEYEDNINLDSIKAEELVVLLKRNPEIAHLLLNMTNKKAKRLYVQARHKQTIEPINSNNKKYEGYWHTHVYVDGKRKAVLKPTEDKLYEYLFDFYHNLDDKTKTFDETFNLFVESKLERGRSVLTAKEYKRYHGYIPESIRKKDIALISEDELRKWFVNDFLSKAPKKEAMKKMLQQLKAVFTFGVRKGYCFSKLVPVNRTV